MAEDVTSLVLKVESNQVGKASKELDKLSRSGKKTEKATDGVTGGFKKMLGPLLAIGVGLIALGKSLRGLEKLVTITREFDILNAQLVTSTGSAENAAVAFGAIQEFATNTPFQLGEVTEAFVQLVNRGLDPSEKSLTNIGNFASAFGRNILDATRAIGQATTGEFESLKQFGIVARKEGERVKFTFRGITQEVAFNAKEIQGYMNNLAENNFSGAMGERMNTLDGAMSNLQDAWDKLWLSTSETGLGSIVEQSVRIMITAIETFESKISGGKFGEMFDGLALALRLINKDIQETSFGELADEITEVGVALTRYGDANFRNKALDELIGQYKEMTNALDRGGLEDGIAGLTAEIRNQETALGGLLEELDNSLGTKKQGILSKETEEATKRLGVLRFMLEGLTGTLKDFKDVEATDRLKGFNVGADEAEDYSPGQNNALDKLRDSLEGEYIIYQDYFAEKKGILLEQATEEQEILDDALAAKEMGDEEFRELSKERWSRYSMDLAEITRKQAIQTQQQVLQNYSSVLGMAGDLTGQLQSLAGESTAAQAVLFTASKGIAIAQAVINTELAATKALAEGGMILGIPMASAIRALGYASVGLMVGQTVGAVATGNYADGGVIPGTSFAGDNLTANVNSGEMVINRDQQNRLFGMANGQGGGGGSTNITVVNNAGVDVQVQERQGENGEKNFEIMLNKVEKTLASRVSSGGSLMSRTLESTYGVKRGNS